MPYEMDSYTKYIYSLKMHDYLASGKPVVSVPIRSVVEFKHVITLASNGEEWSNALACALSPRENAPVRCAERQKVAREDDWEALVARIAHTIAGRLPLHIPSASVAAVPLSPVVEESSCLPGSMGRSLTTQDFQ
jgi:hypothetical protein